MKIEKWFQCRFEQQTLEGLVQEVAWIPERGAKVGNRVELKGKDGLWLVTSVGASMSAADLSEKKRKDRGSLPSLQVVS